MEWIGVDLDGTLAEYHPGDGITQIGAPIPLMVARVRRWLQEGYEVRILTARVTGWEGDRRGETLQRTLIAAWCREHLGCELPVTATKDWEMMEVWDDRAIRVEHNTGRVCSPYECIGAVSRIEEPA